MTARVAFRLTVRPEMIDAYIARHSPVWPDMLAEIEASGRRNYSIFLAPDGQLFGYVELPDSWEEATARMQLEEVDAQWQASVAHLFSGGEHAGAESFGTLEEVFHLD